MSVRVGSVIVETGQNGVFAPYRRKHESGLLFYAAGFPGYPGNFSRDGLITGLLTGDADILQSQLELSALFQGTKYDPLTGEEPGKIHHELPGAQLPGRMGFTTYNACDTTALFLIAAEGLIKADGDRGLAFIQRHKKALEQAAQYIEAHLTADNLFEERPPKGAAQYNLRVTYWKDSTLPEPGDEPEPEYPIIYAQAHFVNARGLLAASRLLGQPTHGERADAMYQSGIAQFVRQDGFVPYRDMRGERVQASSDELHSLAYIPSDYAPLLPVEAIRIRTQCLETPFGYQCTPSSVAKLLADGYHGERVWVMDQAFIHYGATRFGLLHEATVAASVAPHIAEGQELFIVHTDDAGSIVPLPDGNDKQLWSVAATEYFAGRSLLATNHWL